MAFEGLHAQIEEIALDIAENNYFPHMTVAPAAAVAPAATSAMGLAAIVAAPAVAKAS